MFKNLVSASLIALMTSTTIASATGSVSITEEKVETDSNAALVGGVVGGTVAAGAAGTAAALSAAGLVAVPHAAGGMILLSTGTGASYIAGTLGVIGGAAACVASVVCAVAVAGGVAVAAGGGYYLYETLTADSIDFDDVIGKERRFVNGVRYYEIEKKFLTKEARDDLWIRGTEYTNDDTGDIYIAKDDIMVDVGIIFDTYFVNQKTYKLLREQFKSGGLYEGKE